MARVLLIAVRFHEGRYHGAGGWPPAPARLFQALLAGAARGAAVPDAAARALDWLEGRPPPVIAAPRASSGQPYTMFVPNNDIDSELSKKAVGNLDRAIAATRVGKQVHPFLFDAGVPVLYCWSIDDDRANAARLRELAEGLYQLGRGIDMAWASADVVETDEAERRLSDHGGILYRPTEGAVSERGLLCPRPGTRASLDARFTGMQTRFRTGGTNRKPMRVFVQPPRAQLELVAYDAPPRRFLFELREGGAGAGFAERRLSAAATLVAEARDKAADRLAEAMPGRREHVERHLVGRGATDADKAARVCIVPIPSVGHPHADSAIRRLAVYVPQSCPLAAGDLAWAFAQVAWTDVDGVVWSELRQADDERMAARFERAGQHWRSVTPLALPPVRPRRSGKETGAAERAAREARAATAVRQALRHAGVRARAAGVRVRREPFERHGARAESFAAGTRFPADSLWHAAIDFAEPVASPLPLLLGNGRFLGLGLMRASEPMRDVLAFAIVDGLEEADSALVARAARRAMMARVQAALPRGEKLPAYVCGHEEDGRPAGDGSHRHLAVVADLPRRRILYVAPTRLHRGAVRWPDVAQDHRAVADELEGMEVLRAGRAGRLALAPALLDPDDDPLFAPARVWESVTDYAVARHRRRLEAGEALKADAADELRRRGWPAPAEIEILDALQGPRGGLSGRLRLAFAAARAGPLILGRTAHKGGGLFAGR